MYLWYLALFFILLIAELSSYNLTTIWIALGALLTSVYAYFFPDQITIQIILLLVLSIVFIILTKPFIKKLKYAKEKTNADRLVGVEGIVIEKINSTEGTGQVKVSGQIWSAKSYSGVEIAVGEIVKIKNIEGVKQIVDRKESLCKV